MAEGYDSLLQTRRRMQALEDELDQRRLELGAITQRVDGLLRQATATKKASDEVSRATQDASANKSANTPADAMPSLIPKPNPNLIARMRAAVQAMQASNANANSGVRADADAATLALDQLNRLTAMITNKSNTFSNARD